jgi:STE24 endopeptidase
MGLMTETEVELNRERQEAARHYARLRRRLTLLDLGLSTIYLLLWLLLSWTHQFQTALVGWLGGTAPWWLSLLLTAAAMALPYGLLTSPLSYYRGYILPHRFELSTQSLADWLVDQLKGMALSLVLGVPLLIGFYAVIRAAPATWWLWAAGLYTLVSVILAALAPVLLLPIFYNLTPLGEPYEQLRQRLVELARSAGTRVEGVFEIDMSRRTKAANAALTGLGKTRRILLGDTLLERFEQDEIETILAHELAHHVHGDIPLGMAIQSALNFVSFLVLYLGFRSLLQPLGLVSQADPAGLPLVALLLGAFGLITMPLSNAYSRWREWLADEYALNLTRKPRAFSSAMTRLANQNLAEVNPEAWVVWLLYSHPPLSQRLEHASQKQEYFEGQKTQAAAVEQ